MKHINSGIYRITQIDTGKVYIGSSLNIEQRWKRHIRNLSREIHHNKKMQIDAIEFGVESFQFDILELTEPDNAILCNRERFWQDSTRADFDYNQFSRSRSSLKSSRLCTTSINCDINILNPLWKVYRLSGKSIAHILQTTGLSRPTVIMALDKMGIDPQVKWKTLNLIAGCFGKKVVISLNDIDNKKS